MRKLHQGSTLWPCLLNGANGQADYIEHKAGVRQHATWLLATSMVVATMRFATKRCSSGERYDPCGKHTQLGFSSPPCRAGRFEAAIRSAQQADLREQ
jgi:hypothetical protein